MAEIVRLFKKAAIGASSVTLIPATAGGGDNHPADLPVSQIVVSTNGATPPASFWGTATADGAVYRVRLERMS